MVLLTEMRNSGEAAVLRRRSKEEGLEICGRLGLGHMDVPVGHAGGNAGDESIPGAQATSPFSQLKLP